MRSISRLYNHNQGKREHLKEQHVFSCGLIKLKHRQVRCLHGLVAASQLQSCRLEKEHERQAEGKWDQLWHELRLQIVTMWNPEQSETLELGEFSTITDVQNYFSNGLIGRYKWLNMTWYDINDLMANLSWWCSELLFWYTAAWSDEFLIRCLNTSTMKETHLYKLKG